MAPGERDPGCLKKYSRNNGIVSRCAGILPQSAGLMVAA
jgi:hypothetical protein